MWVVVIVVLILYRFYVTYTKKKSYPPGPISFPVLGNIPSLWLSLIKYKYVYVVMKQWSKKYGNIVGVRLGSIDAVVVSGNKMITEVLTREEFDGRPNGQSYLIRSFEKNIGVALSEGETWKKSRRILHKGLRSFGIGSQRMENDMIDECNLLIGHIIKTPVKSIHVNELFTVAVFNILWKLVAGKRYDVEDETFQKLCRTMEEALKAFNVDALLSALPWLKYIVPGLTGYTELKSVHEEIHAFFTETIEEHKSSVDPKNPRDVLDILIIEMTQNEGSFTQEEVNVICMDLLQAGVETVKNTLGFLFLYLLLNPDVQRKLQREIDTEVGSRKPILQDRTSLVYVEATILETLRMSSIAPLTMPHRAMKDTKLGDYDIPKGTYVLPALHDLHNDEIWGDPTEFRPERFITEDNKLRHDDRLMPFGLGRRRCPGETLSRSELFIFLTHFLQRFNLKQPEDDAVPTTEPIDGITLSAQDFRIVFEPRF